MLYFSKEKFGQMWRGRIDHSANISWTVAAESRRAHLQFFTKGRTR
jgi:hypothetical protein